jgi:3-oxoacyl-[acyl-carrier protein] reductase
VPNSAAEGPGRPWPSLPELAGARVLVTGAAGGIGAALAEAFGHCRAVVGIHYHANRQGAETLLSAIEAAGGSGVVLQADLRAPRDAHALVDRFVDATGGLDVLVNNAGGPELLKPLTDLSDDEFDAIFDLNARSVFATSRSAIPHLRRSTRGASIINVTSLSARLGSGPGAAIYGASKAFVGAMSKTLARELAAEGIRVNALSPGFIDTPLHSRHSDPQRVAQWIGQIPMGRGGAAADCIGTALFLASPLLSGFVTGQIIEVNGGQHMGG